MSNCYSIVTAEEVVKCSKQDFEALQKLWEPEGYDEEGYCLESSGLSLEFDEDDNTLFIFSDEFGEIAAVPDEALKVLGAILAKAGRDYLEFGVAYYSDRTCPGSADGGAFRVYADGTVKQAKLMWTD